MTQKKNNLMKLRKKESLTQKDVAKIIGISTRTYQNYEKGRRTPTLEVAKKFADIFLYSIDDIFFENTDCEMQYENQI